MVNTGPINGKFEATFHPGGAPLPRRVPMESLVAWEQPPDDRVPDGWIESQLHDEPDTARPRIPNWLLLVLVIAIVLVLVGAVNRIVTDADVPVRPPVTTTGVCEKDLVGQYRLVATVTARNDTTGPQSGTVWVRWPIVGEPTVELTRAFILTPGQSVEFPVSEQVTASRWFNAGTCSFGWLPS